MINAFKSGLYTHMPTNSKIKIAKVSTDAILAVSRQVEDIEGRDFSGVVRSFAKYSKKAGKNIRNTRINIAGIVSGLVVQKDSHVCEN
jgi:hypothetical protein